MAKKTKTEVEENPMSEEAQILRRKGSFVYKLTYPIEWGDEMIETITLKRPKAKHIAHLSEKSGLGDILRVISKVSGHSQAIINELDGQDATALADLMGELL